MKVSFDGIGDSLITFMNDGVKKGEICKVGAAGTVAPCAAGNAFDGLAVFAEGEYAGVRLRGFVTAPYTGTAPAVGRAVLAANGSGGVKTAENGNTYIVVDKDTVNKTVTFLM